MKDLIILKYECDSNLDDVADTNKLCVEVAEHMKSFKGNLTNVGVVFIRNPQQRVKQSKEFLEKNPEWIKQERKYLDSVKNVPKKDLEQGFREYVDNLR